LLALALLALPEAASAGAAAPAAPGGVGQVAALQTEVQRREMELAQARAQLQQEERLAAREAAEIEQIKAQPDSVGRDLELQRKLAGAQERADRLSQRAARRRQIEGELRAVRQRLMRSCDQLLGDGAAQLGAAQRLELLKV